MLTDTAVFPSGLTAFPMTARSDRPTPLVLHSSRGYQPENEQHQEDD
jgi:hypothetical protein